MTKSKLPSLKAGWSRLINNPQLWWTIIVAVVIFIAFLIVANMFVSIAQNAQDRLVNVRVGSIQDTLVEFVPDLLDDTDLLQKKITSLTSQNPTIREFKIVQYVGNDPVIVASLYGNEVGGLLEDSSEIASFARNDRDNSYTFEKLVDGERFFNTVRSFESGDGKEGLIVTEQTLSEADRLIDRNISNSVVVFVVITLVVMSLFFRHARIVDYVSLYKRLKEVDELKDDFVSMASHELRTPLTIIRGYAELLRDAKELTEDSKVNAKRIDIAAKQLNDLVSDMLDVSRIEQGRLEFNTEKIDPTELIKETVETFGITTEDKGLKIFFDRESGGVIDVDKVRFRQVLINIIGNSVKYTKKGEVKVSMKSENGKLKIRVSDTGIGMTAEDKDKLFEKFHRVKTEETKEIRGTGLGLWITKQIVENMKGSISVESIKNVGTHFVIEFPVVKA